MTIELVLFPFPLPPAPCSLLPCCLYDDLTKSHCSPYQLAADIYGIGFLTADKIARNIGIAPDSEFRYRAGIIHCLSEAAEDSHCYL